ncbi:MAG: WD40 repeat domain-containing protein [Pseudomonadota bacterium]
MFPKNRPSGTLATIARRPLTALALVVACVAPTSLPAAEQSDDAAEQALRGQSRFLALAAEQALEGWAPDKALLLALNALPGVYGGDRPVVPTAHMALNRALHESGRLNRVEVEEDPLFGVISPDGRFVAVVPEDSDIIEVFEIGTAERVLVAEHESVALHAAFSGDSALLATLGDDGLRLWNPAKDEAVAHFDWRVQDEPTGSEKIDSGESLSSVFAALSSQSVDLPTLGGAGDRDGQRPLVAFSPDGTVVAFAGDGNLEVRRVANGEVLHRADLDPKFLYFDDDGTRVMAMDRDNDEFFAVDSSTGDVERLAGDLTVTRTLSGADDARLGGVENGHLILFNALGERTTEIRTRSFLPDADDGPDARGSLRASTLISTGPGVVAGGTSAGVLVWDPEKTDLQEHFRGGNISSLAVSDDGEYLVAGKATGEVHLWDTDYFGSLWLEAEGWAMPGHDERVVFVGFAGDDTAVSLGEDRTLTIAKLPARKTALDEWGQDWQPSAVLSRDGRWVSKYNERQSTLTIWDARTGEQLSSVNRTVRPLSPTSFNANGPEVLASSPMAQVLGEDQAAADRLDFASDETSPATRGRPSGVNQSIYVGDRIVTAATERKLSFSIWDADSGRLTRTVEGERLLAGSWRGSKLLTLSDRELMLHDLDAATAVPLEKLASTVDPEALVAQFDDLGQRLLICSGSELVVWDTSTGKIIDSLSVDAEPKHYGLSPDGSRWFTVIDGVLTIRQDGVDVDQIDVEERNLLFSLIDDRLVTVTWSGTLLEMDMPRQVSVEEAIAQLPWQRSCLSPDEREAYDLPALSDAQWEARGCLDFATSSR